MNHNSPGLDTALAGLEAIVKGGPMNPMDAPGTALDTPGSPLAKDAPNDISKGDDPDYDLGEDDDDDEDEGEGLSKGILDYADMDLSKGLDAGTGEHPLITLSKGLDLMTGDMVEAIAAGFAGQTPVNEALVKALGSSIQRVDQQTELIKGLVTTIADVSEQLAGVNQQLTELGAKPVARRALTPGVQVLEKAVAGTTPADPNANPAFARTYGLHPDKLREKLVKGIGSLGLDMGLANVMDRTGTVEPAVFERIKDL